MRETVNHENMCMALGLGAGDCGGDEIDLRADEAGGGAERGGGVGRGAVATVPGGAGRQAAAESGDRAVWGELGSG